MFRYLTAGESHGEKLVGIIEGLPANLEINLEKINHQLRKRQEGYGRSNRMKLESDKINIISGISDNKTTGNPLSFFIENKGRNIVLDKVLKPRPGHADLVGYLKYNQEGSRNILERASARETATRVAVGAICREFLSTFKIEIYSHVTRIGQVETSLNYYNNLKLESLKLEQELNVISESDREKMIGEIERAKITGDSIGGEIEIIICGAPIGLGSYTNWDRKLDGKLAFALMSIQGIKSVSIGSLKDEKNYEGSHFHDEIEYDEFYRHTTNNAGGIEGGMSNGEDIVIRVNMKPIPTLKKGLKTVDVVTKQEDMTNYERSDVCAVSAASVVCENVVAITIMEEFLKVFGGDFLEEIKSNYENYKKYLGDK